MISLSFYKDSCLVILFTTFALSLDQKALLLCSVFLKQKYSIMQGSSNQNFIGQAMETESINYTN